MAAKSELEEFIDRLYDDDVEYVADKIQHLVNNQRIQLVGSKGESLLHKAASSGSIRVLKFLLSMGIPINTTVTPEITTPLSRAIEGSITDPKLQYSCVKFLLEEGADPTIGRTLVSAVRCKHQSLRVPILDILIQFGGNINECHPWFNQQDKLFTALDHADSDSDEYQFLLSKGAKHAWEIVGNEKSLHKKTELTAHGSAVVEICSKIFGRVEQEALIEIVPTEPTITVHAVHRATDIILFTSGMSTRPMRVSAGCESYQFAELFIQLPMTWAYKMIKSAKWNWPILWLRQLAREPHDTDTFIGPANVFVNGSPPAPIAAGVKFDSFLAISAHEIPREDGEILRLYQLFPLYPQERQLADQQGIHKLCQRLDAEEIDFTVNIKRKNVAL